jgi:hypothetical protein
MRDINSSDVYIGIKIDSIMQRHLLKKAGIVIDDDNIDFYEVDEMLNKHFDDDYVNSRCPIHHAFFVKYLDMDDSIFFGFRYGDIFYGSNMRNTLDKIYRDIAEELFLILEIGINPEKIRVYSIKEY